MPARARPPTLAGTILDQLAPEQARTQHAWGVDTLQAKCPTATDHLGTARESLLTCAASPGIPGSRCRRAAVQRRPNKAFRRTGMAGIFLP